MIDPSNEAPLFERAEVRLREWSATIEQIASAVEALAAHAEAVADSHVAELNGQLKRAREKLEASKSVTGDGWPEAKGEVEALWVKMRELVRKYDLEELA